MSTVIDLMLKIRENHTVFYHKDTNQFDYYPISSIEFKQLPPEARINYEDSIDIKNKNNFRLPSYEEIDHKEIMRFFVRECVEDESFRKQLFDILRRNEYIDPFLDKLHELGLYSFFAEICGDIYIQIFEDWADKNSLDFKNKK